MYRAGGCKVLSCSCELPGARRKLQGAARRCQELPGPLRAASCLALSGSSQELPDSCWVAARSCQELSGRLQAARHSLAAGSCPTAARSCQEQSGSCELPGCQELLESCQEVLGSYQEVPGAVWEL